MSIYKKRSASACAQVLHHSRLGKTGFVMPILVDVRDAAESSRSLFAFGLAFYTQPSLS